MKEPYKLSYSTTPASLLGRAVAAVGAAIVLTVAFFLGFFVLAILLGIATIAGLILWLRLWWLQRQMTHQAPRGDRPGSARPDQGQVIEGEFFVVREQRRRPPPD